MNAVLQEKPRPAPRSNNTQNASIDRRLTVLETKWEEVIPNLATKADLERGLGELRTDIHKMDASIARWMLGTIIALIIGFGGMFFALQRNMDNAITRIERLYMSQPAPAVATPQPPPAVPAGN